MSRHHTEGRAGVLSTLRPRLAERLRARARLDDEAGLGLVEIVIAVFILTVGLAALAATAIPALGSLQNSRDRQAATAMATASLERARTYPMSQLAMDSGLEPCPSDLIELDRDGDLAETPVCDSDGLVNDGSPHWYESAGRTARTYVTNVEEAPGARRVTVVVSWQRGNQDFEVRSSTVVAGAGEATDDES